MVLYNANTKPLKELKQWLSFYEQFWENKLSILKHIVENPEDTELTLIKSETGKDRES